MKFDRTMLGYAAHGGDDKNYSHTCSLPRERYSDIGEEVARRIVKRALSRGGESAARAVCPESVHSWCFEAIRAALEYAVGPIALETGEEPSNTTQNNERPPTRDELGRIAWEASPYRGSMAEWVHTLDEDWREGWRIEAEAVYRHAVRALTGEEVFDALTIECGARLSTEDIDDALRIIKRVLLSGLPTEKPVIIEDGHGRD